MTHRLADPYYLIAGDADFGGRILYYGEFYQSATNVSAYATGGLANATQLLYTISFVTVCATANDSVKLKAVPSYTGAGAAGIAGPMFIVWNLTANVCDVYPGNASHQIDGLGAGNPYNLAAGARRGFIPSSSTQWRSW